MEAFTCQYCGQSIQGERQFTLAFQMGFIWNAAKFDQPAWHFDFCRECEKTFIKKYLEGQAERRAAVEAERLRTWQKRLGIVEKRKMAVEVYYARRSGDQLKLFNERKVNQWEERTGTHLQGLRGHALLANAKKRMGSESVPNARHKLKQMERSILN